MKSSLILTLVIVLLLTTFAQAGEVTTSIPDKKRWLHGAVDCVDYYRDGHLIMQKVSYLETGFTVTCFNLADPEDDNYIRDKKLSLGATNEFQVIVNRYTGGKMEISKHACSKTVLVDLVDKNGDGKDDVLLVTRYAEAKSQQPGKTRLLEAFDISMPGEVAPLSEKALAAERKRVEF